MPQDLYKDFADRYDWFFDNFIEHNHKGLEFYRQIFEDHHIHSVLDCACGTGYDLHLFHSLGCEIVGSDISESMLNQARKILAECGIDVPLYNVDYRKLPENFDRKFDAVACLSSSILHMPNYEEVIRAFRSMRKVLRDGGLLILTQGTSDKQWRQKPRFILANDTNEFSRLFVIDYHNQGATYNILDIIRSGESPELKVWSIDYPQMLLKDDFDKLLKASGFKTIDFYGNYQFDHYDIETSNLLIVVATA